MLKQRLISGLSIGGICLLAFLVPGIIGAVLFSLLGLVLIWVLMGEFANLTARMEVPCMRVPLQIFGSALLVLHALPPLLFGRPVLPVQELGLLFVFLLTTAFLAVLQEDLKQSLARWLCTLAGMGLIYGTLRFVPALYFKDGLNMGGRLLLLFVIAITKFGDIGAYALGVYTARKPGGNHKLWPRLSPKKSWEGLAGGVLAAIAISWLLLLVLPVGYIFGTGFLQRLTLSACLAVVLTLTGLLGDLTESALKRAAGAKDSGNVPGLGGVFDFVDSLIFNVPLFWLVAALV